MATKVSNAKDLMAMIAKGKRKYFIVLAGGLARSSKTISYDKKAGVFKVKNEIDGTRQQLTEQQLFDSNITNIGKAMNYGAFFAD